MKLYLIRHAESEANVRRVLDTALPGPPLTERGRQQAQALADRLRDEPLAAVYASYATRAQQTAEPLAEAFALEVQSIEGVHEVGVGALEGLGDPDSNRTYTNITRAWTRGDLNLAMPGGGESGERLRARFTTAVAELRAKHEAAGEDAVVALVSHGGAIRLNAEWLSDNVRPEVADQGLLPNTGIVVLESLPRGGWTCLSWAGAPM
ncbi:histidine phosphatase family protein [Amycolatopsis taiwanensis]|uniref:Phosphoglycerate mutase n=1 Tax=Amycolatopsis taiwanensis TaxID=342230 RepID=A0A9W6QXY4_9PSEU|nr:histidine phosphatase family protein [Amycolatopsis taiwanensis]GLY64047.1 phosphoglycerate mutase [Amycolatopsis taiwanensis]